MRIRRLARGYRVFEDVESLERARALREELADYLEATVFPWEPYFLGHPEEAAFLYRMIQRYPVGDPFWKQVKSETDIR